MGLQHRPITHLRYDTKMSISTVSPVRNTAIKALVRLGIRSSSDRQESSNLQPHDATATPIVVLGFARTGTTTIQSRLAASLRYNRCFEPFASKANLPPQFPNVNSWFMGAPPPTDLDRLCRPSGCAIAPDAVTDSTWKQDLQESLRGQIKAIHKAYGWNCVWKEIRLVPTLPSLRTAYDALGKRALFIGVLGNPLGCTYSYYRLLALGRAGGLNGLRPGSLWDYRRNAYLSQGYSSKLFDIRAHSGAEHLILASLIDQEFLRWQAEQHPDAVFLTDLEGIPALATELSEHLSIHAEPVPALAQRPPAWAGDPWFKSLVIDRLSPEVLDALRAHWPLPSEAPTKTRSARAWWSQALNRTMGGL